jgi:hypothetical protein
MAARGERLCLLLLPPLNRHPRRLRQILKLLVIDDVIREGIVIGIGSFMGAGLYTAGAAFDGAGRQTNGPASEMQPVPMHPRPR